MLAIECHNLSKRFGTLPVLADLSFSVEPGRALCLFGPSGSGKTTLLRLIAGLERPDVGSIRLFDQIVADEGLSVPPAERNIGFVFQDFVLWPHMRVERHLDFVLRAANLPRRERRERIAELLDTCRLENKRRAYPAELSGGQQQRLAIARALANRPSLLLLDEPFSNLDADLRAHMAAEFCRLKTESNVTLVLATHIIEDAAAFTDATLHIPPSAPPHQTAATPN